MVTARVLIYISFGVKQQGDTICKKQSDYIIYFVADECVRIEMSARNG